LQLKKASPTLEISKPISTEVQNNKILLMRVRSTNTQSGTHPLKCTHEAHAEGGHTYHACSCTEWGEGSSL